MQSWTLFTHFPWKYTVIISNYYFSFFFAIETLWSLSLSLATMYGFLAVRVSWLAYCIRFYQAVLHLSETDAFHSARCSFPLMTMTSSKVKNKPSQPGRFTRLSCQLVQFKKKKTYIILQNYICNPYKIRSSLEF